MSTARTEKKPRTPEQEKRHTWYMKNREKNIERARQWALAHPKEKAASSKKSTYKWRANNPEIAREQSLASQRKRRKEQPKHVREVRQVWEEANPDKHYSYTKKWRAKNPELLLAQARRHRALKHGAQGSYTLHELEQLYKYQYGHCFYCRDELRPGYHADHMTPLCRGGSNDISNICLSCPTCNLSKNALTHEEFLQRRSRFSEVVELSPTPKKFIRRAYPCAPLRSQLSAQR